MGVGQNDRDRYSWPEIGEDRCLRCPSLPWSVPEEPQTDKSSYACTAFHLSPRPSAGLDFVEVIRPLVVFTRCSAHTTVKGAELTVPASSERFLNLSRQATEICTYNRAFINLLFLQFQPSNKRSLADTEK